MPRHHPMISSEYLIILRIGGSDLHDDCPHKRHQHHNQNDMRAQHFPRCSDPPPPLVAPIHSLSDARGSKASTASPFPGYTQTHTNTGTNTNTRHMHTHTCTQTNKHTCTQTPFDDAVGGDCKSLIGTQTLVWEEQKRSQDLIRMAFISTTSSTSPSPTSSSSTSPLSTSSSSTSSSSTSSSTTPSLILAEHSHCHHDLYRHRHRHHQHH